MLKKARKLSFSLHFPILSDSRMELGLEKEQMHDLAEQLLAPQDQMKILHYDHAYKY